MTDVLILGGTGWLSGRIAVAALDAGASVTCLARGGQPAPAGAELVTADRDDPDSYAAVAAQDWDHVIDVSARADHVAAAVEELDDRAARWTYVSSMSVFADETSIGADESARRHPPAEPGDEYDYAREKVASENAVQAVDGRALIVRPGLIVGPGDPSDRFGYWAAAFLRARGGPVLLPPLRDQREQVIDVDDLAGFIVAAEATGAVDAVGDVHALADVLARVRTAAGHTGMTVDADEEQLLAHDVTYWAGERSLPLWLPADMPGFMSRANARFREWGGVLRPIDETIAAVVADERRRGVDRERRAGLTRADELAVIAGLTQSRAR